MAITATCLVYHNMPNATIEDIAKHIQTEAVPHNTNWTSTLLQVPSAFEIDISYPVDRKDTPDSGDSPGSGDTPNSGDQTTQPPT